MTEVFTAKSPRSFSRTTLIGSSRNDCQAHWAPDHRSAKPVWIAVLNDAFRTLRDPVTRAGYFLEEHKIASSKHPPAELLEEVFEMNMALDELRSGDESVRPQLEHARDRFLKLRDEIDHGLSALFIQYDKSLHGNPDESLLLAVRGVLDRRQYVSNLIRDVEKELNVHVSN